MRWDEIFEYRNGRLYWKIKTRGRGGAILPGDEAGSEDPRGYFRVVVNGRRYWRHRIIWEMFNGNITNLQLVRHINDKKGDDRIENLDIGTKRDNAIDRVRNGLISKNNKSGVTGVGWYKRTNKWSAEVMVRGSKKHLGFYDDFFDAVCARKSWDAKSIM